jgi:hypothetical protein
MKKQAVDGGVKLLSEEAAAQTMWNYYKENKAQLASDTREYREIILGKLMQGLSAKDVFAPFMQSATLSIATNKVCKAAQNKKQKRPAWPFATT